MLPPISASLIFHPSVCWWDPVCNRQQVNNNYEPHTILPANNVLFEQNFACLSFIVVRKWTTYSYKNWALRGLDASSSQFTLRRWPASSTHREDAFIHILGGESLWSKMFCQWTQHNGRDLTLSKRATLRLLVWCASNLSSIIKAPFPNHLGMKLFNSFYLNNKENKTLSSNVPCFYISVPLHSHNRFFSIFTQRWCLAHESKQNNHTFNISLPIKFKILTL